MDNKAFRESWSRIRREVRKKWPRLSEAEVRWVGGVPDRLVRCLREKYGVPAEYAVPEVDAWFETIDRRPVVRR